MRALLLSLSCKTLLTLITFPLWGSPLPCAPTTLSDYVNLAEGCTVDDLLFSNFGFTANTATSNPGTGDILIAPLLSSGPGDWSGIQISSAFGQFLLASEQLNMDFEITYSVSSATPYYLYSAFLFAAAETTGSGNHARVREIVDYGSGDVEMQANHGANGPHISDFPPVEWVEITKNFILDTGKTGGSASIDFVDQRFSTGLEPTETPEPMTILLAGCGLLALGFCRRRCS